MGSRKPVCWMLVVFWVCLDNSKHHSNEDFEASQTAASLAVN